MRLGEIEVIPVSDGFFKMPPTYFGVDDWGVHKDLADSDGMLEVPIGCFVVRSGDLTVLIDAGLGPIDLPGTAHGGDLMTELAAADVKPDDVDLVLLTHLHLDHIGWTVQNGAIQFPNATIRFGEQDLGQFVGENPDPMSAPTINAFMEHGKVEPITSDGEIAPGISTMHAPGHTMGHRCVVLSSGDERMLLLGDAVTCPVQLEETDWGAMSDVDPAMSKRTREALFKELEASGDIAVGAHFPGLQFGRVLTGQGKRYFA
jgi:glyoxylase-like metal-dependent hydrolase (beta-lactamase superfamily II)